MPQIVIDKGDWDTALDAIIEVVEKGVYDFKIVDNGGVRGEDLSVEEMIVYNPETFKKELLEALKTWIEE